MMAMTPSDQARLTQLLRSLISAQDNVTHLNETNPGGVDVVGAIARRDRIRDRIVAFVDSLVIPL